ncbi:MAG: HAD-IC family P-type ATPase [Bryobacterales bacterium]|nr:HAD-IC family P-type ATPase [Bryobacterales bacterium]
MARVEVRAGEFEQRPASEVRAGELLEELLPENDPVDGILLSEGALFEEASVRGEFVPRPRAPGETVMAGSFVLDSQVRLRAVPPPGDSSLDSLLCEVGMGIDTRSQAQQMADRLARWFVPVVASVAAATFAGWSAFVPASEALFHAMAVLLVACPCALGFATPLALWTATSRLSALGIRVSKASDVETLSTVDLVVFDKTGTLSAAGTHLSRIEWLDSAPYPPQCMEAMVVAAERDLHHPFARAMERSGMSARASSSGCDWAREELRILPGKGIWTRVREAQGAVHELEVISRSAMQERQVRSAGDGKHENGAEGIAFVLDGIEAGSASFEEEFRDGREAALDRFAAMGVELQLLSGDSHARVARTGIAAAQSSLSPTEKREKVAQWQRAKRKILFVGDGINDAPAMAAADIAIAVDEGAALARAVANGVWDGGNLEAIPAALGIARQTVRRVRTNFRWAIGYNTAGMALAAAGLLHPVSAAVLMVASSAQVTWRAMALLGDTSIDALSAGARPEPASAPRGYLPAEREPSPSVRVTG